MRRLGTKEEVDRLVRERGVAGAGNELGVAALIYTYRCTIACRHCGFSCAGHRPDVRMTTEQAVRHLGALHETGRVIHVAGGECMMYWDELRAALAEAQKAGVSPHFIETNCSWASRDELVRARCEDLRSLGVSGLLASADPFHQVFVSPENFIRVRRIAAEVFGPENIWASRAPDERIRDLPAIAQDEARLAEYVRKGNLIMVGTAHAELERFFPERPLAELPLDAGWHVRYATKECLTEFHRDTLWEIHIDPYDNIMSNCGVMLGDANRTRVREVLERGPETVNEFARVLAAEGPFGLARLAHERHGYAIPERARTKCGFCFDVRCFLRPFYPQLLGPAEVYGEK